jgi:hypothetical protein
VNAEGKLVNLDGVVDHMGFLDRLRWTLQYHENVGAHTCIEDLGYQYIHTALLSAGFCDRQQHGMWLGGNYGNIRHPGSTAIKPAAGLRVHVAGKGDKFFKGYIQSATAAAVADFLTRMETYLIFDSDEAVEEMTAMMRTGSFFVDLGLAPAEMRQPQPPTKRYRPTRMYNRVGQQDGASESAAECAVIECGPLIRYAAVCLGAAGPEVLGKVIVKLHDVIRDRSILRNAMLRNKVMKP